MTWLRSLATLVSVVLALASLVALHHNMDALRVQTADAHFQHGDRPEPSDARTRYPGSKHGIVAKPGEADGLGGPLELERPGEHIDDDDDSYNNRFLGESSESSDSSSDSSSSSSSSDSESDSDNHDPHAGAWHVRHGVKQDPDRAGGQADGRGRDSVATTRKHIDFEFARDEHHDPAVIDAADVHEQAHVYESGKQDPNRPSRGTYNARRWTGRKHPDMH